VKRLFPFLTWIHEVRDPRILRADLIAGITVALVLIPQSMAYAQLAGLPPYYGLYAAFLPPAIAALWGSSRQLATGPVAMVSLMTAAALAPFAAAGVDVVPVAILMALVAGIFQLSLGVLRLGLIVDFLSHPVLIGVTNAAALVIATSQLDKLLGVKAAKAAHHYESVWNMLVAASHGVRPSAIGIGALAFAIMIGAKRIDKRIPGVLVAVVATTALAWWLGYADAGGKVVGQIPQGLPSFHLPELSWDAFTQVLGPAILLSVIGFVEAISIAKSMALRTRQRVDANQELIGQGLANLAGAVTQSYPVSGSFSRSAVNLSAGALSGFASVVTSIVVITTLLFLTPLMYHLPEATLAAVIMMAVANLVKVQPIIHAWKVVRRDALVAIATFTITLVAAPHLDVGIIAGVGLSLVAYLATTMRPRVAVLARHPDGSLRDAAQHGLSSCDTVLVIRFDGRLYFANTSHFEDRLIAELAERPQVRAVVIAAAGINSIDSTGEEVLGHLVERLESQGARVVFMGLRHRIQKVLERTGVAGRLGAERFVGDEQAALELARRLAGCEAQRCATCPLAPKAPPVSA
jgi:SulP family sulfate permease